MTIQPPMLQHVRLQDLIATAQVTPSLNSPSMNEIVRRFTGLAHHIAYEVCRNTHDHDDVVNEALLDLVHAVRAHHPRAGSFPAYARIRMRGRAGRVAARLAGADFLPGDERIHAALERSPNGIEDPVSQIVLGDFGDLTAAVDALPAGQRSAVRLRFSGDRSVGEIARLQAVTPSAVSQRLHAAYSTLRDAAA